VRVGSVAAGAGRDCAPAALIGSLRAALKLTVRFLRNRFRNRLPDEVCVATITYAHHLGSGQAR
jgi:hypothetical protein